MNGARLVTECLKSQGVETLFGYPGGAIMPVYDALYDSGIEHILCRNEQGAAMAAIGYARASGKIGVCISTSGPGATNLITGLGDALMDSIPIVAITGQVAAPLIGTDAFQEADVLGLSLACCKHSFIVQNAEELADIFAEAFHIAQSGRPGPVLIDIPKDVQFAETSALPYVKTAEKPTALSADELRRAMELLKTAERPVLYVGGGVGMAGAVPALREFVKVTRIPSISTLKGLGAIPAGDPYYMSMIGMHGTKAANYAVQEADLLLVFGALVLADVIAAAVAEDPDTVLDVATLTGAQIVALGERVAGVMGSESVRDGVVAAAGRAGEDFWPMPLPAYLRANLDSPFADLRNAAVGNRAGGMLVAGLFLREFAGRTPWAHLDIAGPAYNEKAAWGLTPTGGTGFGVATLLTFLETRIAAAQRGRD